MPLMEVANCMVNIGGDAGNQAQKHAISPAEIAVVRAVHGDESVHDIEPLPAVKRSLQDEFERLLLNYGQSKANHDLIRQMYPRAEFLPLRLTDLGLDEFFYKATSRMAPTAQAAPGGAAPSPTAAAVDEDEEDFETINDAHTARDAAPAGGDIFG